MTVLDLFAGPGGWDVAAQRLGLDPLGIETDTAACQTREAAGLRTVQYDVARYLDERYYMETPLQGLIASPPCQTFSMAGKGAGRQALDLVLELLEDVAAGLTPAVERFNDPRTALVLQPLIYARDTGPQWMVWEQVPTVLPVWEACADVLRAWGYNVWVGKLNAEEYGVPQTRKRAVLIASQTRRVGRPAATHTRYVKGGTREVLGLLPWVSMADALGWGMTERPYPTIACARSTGGPDMEKVGGSAARLAIYGEMAAGRWVLRNNTSANAATRDQDEPAPTLYFGERMNGVYWLATGTRPNAPMRSGNEPAPTLAFGHDAASHVWVPSGTDTLDIAQMKRDGLCVRLSLEEAGILQSFPGDYPWQGNASKKFQQVGNAVPPLLGMHVLAEATGLALPVAEEVAA